MKISVITPSYNSGNSFERAVQSVLSQDYPNYEHIVVDGGSTDGTLDILKKYDHIRWVSEPDNGQVDAMNKGFRMATGDIIVYLNADDHFMGGAFSTVIPYFQAGEKFVMGKVAVRTQTNKGVHEWINDPKTDFLSILRHWEPDAFCVNPVGYYYVREVQDAIPYREETGAKHDLEFLMEVSQRYKIKKIDTVLGVFNHSIATQTALEQQSPSYWRAENFPFVDRLIQHLPEEERCRFRLNQQTGYQLRRRWTIREAIQRGDLKKMIANNELFFLPQDESNTSREKGAFLDFDRIASKGDWIIPVLTMGKVASKAIHACLNSLPEQLLPVSVYHLHQINPATLARSYPAKEHIAVGKALRYLFEREKDALQWKVIVGVRDPIACALSGVFELFHAQIKSMRDAERRLREILIPYKLGWFDTQIRDGLGIDVFQHVFDKEKGFTIIKKGNVDILLYRLESLRDTFHIAMEAFLGIPGLTLPHINQAEDKSYSNAYKQARHRMRFSNEFLDVIYSSQLARHFYTVDEIESFRRKWLRKAKDKKKETNTIPMVTPENFSAFTYSKKSHMRYFERGPGKKLYAKVPRPACPLKSYQDMLVFSFLSNNIPAGAKILEIGGGWSRLIDYFSPTYECWNLDKFEGIGNGPISAPNSDARIVDDYIGNFSELLPTDYFDLVFSISVIEHIENNQPAIQNVFDDIDRVLKRGAYSLHCVDIVLGKNCWIHGFVKEASLKYPALNAYIDTAHLKSDPDLFFVPEKDYKALWEPCTKKPYAQFGKPASYNLLWIT